MPISDNNRSRHIRKATLRLAVWTALWLLTCALATFGSKYAWQYDRAFSLAALVFNVVVGIGLIRANILHLMSLDELEQKIHLEAMAITMGVGLIGGISYSLMETTQIIQGNAQISVLIMVMAVTYLASIVWGGRKYR